MYAKIFRQIYDSTLANDWQTLITFQQFLILADYHGTVDMTPEAISRTTNIPLDIIKSGIANLEAPDNQSRSEKEEGRRIIRLSENRDWGWDIVNFEHYKNIKDEEHRREYMREYMKNKRNNDVNSESLQKFTDVSKSIMLAKLAHIDLDIDLDIDTKEREEGKPTSSSNDSLKQEKEDKPESKKTKLSDTEWIESLKANIAYSGIDIDILYAKMVTWCEVKGKKPTRTRLLNWLNREDKPIQPKTKKPREEGEYTIPEDEYKPLGPVWLAGAR